jgi:hypothetical protein
MGMIDKVKYIVSCIYAIFKFIENCFIIPFKKFWDFCTPVRNWYKRLWKKYCYDKYDDFLWKRAIIMIFSTLGTLYLVLSIFEFTFDLTYYLCTKKVETIYLSDSVELEDGLWSAKGCPTKECSSDNALYFRIKNTWFNNIWNLVHHGQIFFPDGIAAGVPTGQTECKVISYGLRYRLVMIFNYYPQILQVNCQAEN